VTPEQFLQRLTQLCRESGYQLRTNEEGMTLWENVTLVADLTWDDTRQCFTHQCAPGVWDFYHPDRIERITYTRSGRVKSTGTMSE
jgi:hypothetical protein